MKTRFARFLAAGGIALASLCCETRSVAQVAPEAAASQSITVNGQSAPVVRNYVKKIAKPVQGRQISRWNEPICIGIDGISEKYASFINDRVSVLARSIKLPVRRPGCHVNLYITLTDQADALAKALVEARPKIVGNVNHNGLLQPSIVTALEAPRTVRWMTASETVSGAGVPFGATNMVYSDSLIRPGTREDVLSKTIIIDETKLSGVTLLQLADYIAYVSVTTPDLSTDFSGLDSIMALFASNPDEPRPTSLTDADRRFLTALYKTIPDRTAYMEQSAIAKQILKGERSDRTDH